MCVCVGVFICGLGVCGCVCGWVGWVVWVRLLLSLLFLVSGAQQGDLGELFQVVVSPGNAVHGVDPLLGLTRCCSCRIFCSRLVLAFPWVDQH